MARLHRAVFGRRHRIADDSQMVEHGQSRDLAGARVALVRLARRPHDDLGELHRLARRQHSEVRGVYLGSVGAVLHVDPRSRDAMFLAEAQLVAAAGS